MFVVWLLHLVCSAIWSILCEAASRGLSAFADYVLYFIVLIATVFYGLHFAGFLQGCIPGINVILWMHVSWVPYRTELYGILALTASLLLTDMSAKVIILSSISCLI